jgi:hypothetical protein
LPAAMSATARSTESNLVIAATSSVRAQTRELLWMSPAPGSSAVISMNHEAAAVIAMAYWAGAFIRRSAYLATTGLPGGPSAPRASFRGVRPTAPESRPFGNLPLRVVSAVQVPLVPMRPAAKALLSHDFWSGLSRFQQLRLANHSIHFAVADFALATRLARTATSCGQTAKSFSEDCPSGFIGMLSSVRYVGGTRVR